MNKKKLLDVAERRLLFFILSIVAMVVLPGFIYVMMNHKTLFSPGSLFLYVLFMVEFVLYFDIIYKKCQPGHLLMVINLSVLFLFIRFITVFVSFVLISRGIGSGDLFILYDMWYAQPLIPIIQIVIFYFIMTDVLIMFVPQLLKEEYLKATSSLELLEDELAQIEIEKETKEKIEETDDDVFSQILSFNALPLSLKKFPNIEGVLIINDEGLVVWKDVPHYINVEDVSGRFLQVVRESSKIGDTLQSEGIAKIVFETGKNTVLILPLMRKFSVVFIFTKKIVLDEIENRLRNFSLVLKEFLERRYKEIRG